MALHVDVFENRWSAGYQRRVARARVENDRIEVEGDQHWCELVRGVLSQVDAEEPQRALEALAEHFKSDYAEAPQPHYDRECPFGEDDQAPFQGDHAPAREAEPAGAGK